MVKNKTNLASKTDWFLGKKERERGAICCCEVLNVVRPAIKSQVKNSIKRKMISSAKKEYENKPFGRNGDNI